MIYLDSSYLTKLYVHEHCSEEVECWLGGQCGHKEIYSHDRHLLAAASHFGLRGIDIITSS